MKIIFFLSLTLLFIDPNYCSHYKGGVFTSFSPNNQSISIKYQLYYKRRGTSTAIWCDDSLIQSSGYVKDPSDPKIMVYYCNSIMNQCKSMQNDALISFDFRCINYDEKNNWSAFENSKTITLNPSLISNYDQILISLQNTQGEWSLDNWSNSYKYFWTHLNKRVRLQESIPVINTPPEVQSFPNHNIKCGCESKFKPTIFDKNPNDKIKCRASSVNYGKPECGLCSKNYIVDSETCTITFPSTLRQSLPVEIQVEDYNAGYMNGTVPMSSTSFQFSAILGSCSSINTQVCDDIPRFTNSIQPSGSCIAIKPNTIYSGKVEAYSLNKTITELQIYVDFVGINYDKSKLMLNSSNGISYYEFNLTASRPDETYIGKAVFKATDNLNLASDEHFINYLFNYEPPEIVDISLVDKYCVDKLNSVQLNFTANRNISKPSSDRNASILFVRNDSFSSIDFSYNTFFSSSSDYSGNIYKLRLARSNFRVNSEYSVLFELGAFTTADYCGPWSEKMSDSNRFRFKVIDDSAVSFSYSINSATLAVSNISIEYSLLNAEPISCHLSKNSDSFIKVNCSETKFEKDNLETGNYSFYLEYKTICDTIIKSKEYKFKIVNDKPRVEFKTNQVNGVYASANVNMTFKCIHPIDCYTHCRLVQNNDENRNDTQFMPCKNNFKPSNALINGMNYTFELNAIDELNNSFHLSFNFTADTEPPQFVDMVPELNLNCGDNTVDESSYMKATDSLDKNPKVTFKDKQISSCLIERDWTAIDHVNNTITSKQQIILKSRSRLLFPDQIKLACVTNKQVIEDLKLYQGFISLDENKCNTTLQLSPNFSTLPGDDCDFEMTVSWNVKDECNILNNGIRVQKVIVDQRQIPYSPLYMQDNVELIPWFKWPVKRTANFYELRIRNSTSEGMETIARIRSNEFRLSFRLAEYESYSWSVAYYSENGTRQEISPSWLFKTKILADLAPTDVRAPPNEILPEEEILVSWTVKNIGRTVTSSSSWYESVYGSLIDTFNSQASLLARLKQNRFLEPNATYTNQFKFSLPERFRSDKYFVFIFINKEMQVEESDYSNNMQSQVVSVGKPKLPNLVPLNIILNEPIKAGKYFTFRCIIENIGENSVKPNKYWYDSIKIYLNRQNLLSKLFNLKNNQIQPGFNYSINDLFFLPKQNYGANATIEINSNYNDLLYESSLADNKFVKTFEILPPDTPDLSVVRFELSKSSYKTGEYLVLNYVVENEGIEDATEYSWKDEIVLKLNGLVIYSQTENVYGPLAKQSAYNGSVRFYLQHQLLDGTYNLELRVDKLKNIFVYSPGSSSIRNRATKINITRSIPTWKVNLSQVRCAQMQKNNQTVNRLDLSYTLGFDFKSTLAQSLTWKDEFYLSYRSSFDLSNAVKLGEINQEFFNSTSRLLATNVSFYLEDLNSLNSLNGNLFVYFIIDSENINEKIFESQNPFKNSVTIPKIISSLSLTYFKVNAPTFDVNSFKIPIEIKLKNTGPNPIRTATFLINAKYFNNQAWNSVKEFTLNELLVNKETNASIIINMNQNVYGQILFQIQAKNKFDFNFDSSLFTFNNISISNGNINSTVVVLEQPKSVDFVVTHLSFQLIPNRKDSACNNNNYTDINVNYVVKNKGFDMIKTSQWKDRIGILCDNQTVYYRNVQVINFLKNSQTYENTVGLRVQNENALLKNCSIVLRVNEDNGAVEIFSKEDNEKKECCFDLPKKPTPNLDIHLMNDPQFLGLKHLKLNSSDSFRVGYYFSNSGDGSALITSKWIDGLYLMNKSSANWNEIIKKGILIGIKSPASLNLNCGSNSDPIYMDANLPSNLAGIWYLHIVHDIESPISKNSTKQVFGNFSLSISKSEPCDLKVINSSLLSNNDTVDAGETIRFYFDITNVGTGKAKGVWFDAVFLSKYPIITSTDIKLLTKKREKELSFNESYRIMFEMRLPLSLNSGEYFVMLQTDSLNILDDTDRENNQNYLRLNVNERPAADLILSNLTIESKSNNYKFKWQLTANRELNGLRCDSYYFSADQLFDFEDHEINHGNCESFSIKQITEQDFTQITTEKTLTIPMLTDGSYYGIVRSVSNIHETNYSNNAAISNEPIQITVNELEFNKEFFALIKPNDELLFKFNVNTTISSFRVNLNTISTVALNDLFVLDNKLPKQNLYVSKSLKPFSFNQTTVTRNAKATTYYVLVKSYMANDLSSNYSISLIVKEVMPVQVDAIYPIRINERGWNTLKFTGNFEPNNFQVCLESKNKESSLLCAKYSYKTSHQILYARFDMADSLFVSGESLNIKINSVNTNRSVEVIKGEIGSVKFDLIQKTKIYRPNQTVYVTVEMLNPGDSDALVPITLLRTFPVVLFNPCPVQPCVFNSILSQKPKSRNNILEEKDIKYKITSINGLPYYSYPYDHLFLYNQDGLGSVLQARSVSSIILEIRPLNSNQTSSQSLHLQPPKEDRDFFKKLISNKINIHKFDSMNGKDWSAFTSHFIERFTSNINEFVYETVNTLSAQNIKTYRFDEIFVYHLNRLDNAFYSENLVDSVDLEIFSSLRFLRVYSARKSARNNSRNVFCSGWSDNLNIKLKKSPVYDSLLLTVYGQQIQIIYKRGENFYFSHDFQIEYYETERYALIYWTKNDLKITYDLNSNCVKEFETANGAKFSASCDSKNGFLKKITNSLLSVSFTYSIRNCLTSINKQNSDTSSEIILYNYDSLNRLSSVKSSSLNDFYSYDSKNNLIKIENDQVLIIEYNKLDNLLSKIEKQDENGLLVYSSTFEYADNGPFKITDKLKNISKTYLYDYSARLVSVSEEGESSLKIMNNPEENRVTQFYRGELYQDIKQGKNDRIKEYFNNQNEKITYEVKYSTEEKSSYQITDYNGNQFLKNIRREENSEQEEIIYPDGTSTLKTRLLADKKLTFKTRSGHNLEVDYDENLNRAFFSHATGDPNRKCYYEYTKLNQIKIARGTDPFDTVEFTYDSLNRLIRSQSRLNSSIEYAYDQKQNLIEIKADKRFHIAYEYDKRNNLIKILNKLTNKEITNLQYLTDNSIRLTNLNDAFVHVFKFDARKDVLVQYTKTSKIKNDLIDVFDYEYDSRNLNTKIKKTTNKGNFSQTYNYDSLGRPISGYDSKCFTSFDIKYDSNGNRKEMRVQSAEISPKTVSYSVNSLNQYTENTDSKFTYDANGKLIEEKLKSSNEINEYVYSEEGKLKMSINSEDNCSYAYDCLEQLSAMNCLKKGKFIFYYHYNSLLENKLSHVLLPNKTILFFVHMPVTKPTSIFQITINKPIQITSSILSTGTSLEITTHEPVLKPDPIQEITKPQPSRPDDLPLTGDKPKPPVPSRPTVPSLPSILNPTPGFNFDLTEFLPNPANQFKPGSFDFPTLPLPTQNKPSKPWFPSSLGDPCSWAIFGGKKILFKTLISNSYLPSEKPIFTNISIANKNQTEIEQRGIWNGICEGISSAVHATLDGQSAFDIFDKFSTSAIPYYDDIKIWITFSCGNFQFKPPKEIAGDFLYDNFKNKILNGLANILPGSAALNCALGATSGLLKPLFDDFWETLWNWFPSIDPNDISGPDGFSNKNFINKEKVFAFKIRYENMNTTVAPAQTVKIDSKLSELFDMRTVQFTGYGFNQYSNEFTSNKKSYVNEVIQIDANYEIRIFATVDLKNSALIWKFSTIDKNTGEVPEDAAVGFLPPNNGTHGEGFVLFEVRLSKSIENLQTFSAFATIVFDNNEPIETNVLTYSVDSKPPELTITYDDSLKQLVVEAKDSESGVHLIQLFNDQTLIFSKAQEPSFIYELDLLQESYLIYAQAEDYVGNKSPLKLYLNQSFSVDKDETKLCMNNCTDNGECNLKYGVCECFESFIGKDCSEKLSTDQLLSKPIDFEISYFESDNQNEFDLNLKLRNASYDALSFEITQKDFKHMENQIEFIFNDTSYKNGFKINTSDQIETFNLKVKSKISQKVVITLNFTTFRFNQDTNNTVVNTNLNDFELDLKSFLPSTFLQLNTTGICYDKNSTDNRIELLLSSFDSKDDYIYVNSLSMSFIQSRIEKQKEKYFLILKSTESFDKIDLTVEFVVNKANENLNFTFINQFSYMTCKIETNDFVEDNGLGTTEIIVIAVVPTVFIVLIVTAVVVLKRRKAKSKDSKQNQTHVEMTERNKNNIETYKF